MQLARRPVETPGFIYSVAQRQKKVLTGGGLQFTILPLQNKVTESGIVTYATCINRVSLQPPQLVFPIGIDLDNVSEKARRHFPNQQLVHFLTAKPLPRCHA